MTQKNIYMLYIILRYTSQSQIQLKSVLRYNESVDPTRQSLPSQAWLPLP